MSAGEDEELKLNSQWNDPFLNAMQHMYKRDRLVLPHSFYHCVEFDI